MSWRGSGLTWFWGQHECLGITPVGPRDKGHLSPCFSQYPFSPQESPFQLGSILSQPPMVWKTVITLAPLAHNLKLPLHQEARGWPSRAALTPCYKGLEHRKPWVGGDLALISPVTVYLENKDTPRWGLCGTTPNSLQQCQFPRNSTLPGDLRHLLPILSAESPPFRKRTDFSLCSAPYQPRESGQVSQLPRP